MKNPDIAKELGKIKKEKIHIGFCAETNDLLQNAREKLAAKNFDMIVANDVTMDGAGFETDTNIVKLLKRDGSLEELPLMQKTEVAARILDQAAEMMKNRK